MHTHTYTHTRSLTHTQAIKTNLKGSEMTVVADAEEQARLLASIVDQHQTIRMSERELEPGVLLCVNVCGCNSSLCISDYVFSNGLVGAVYILSSCTCVFQSSLMLYPQAF